LKNQEGPPLVCSGPLIPGYVQTGFMKRQALL
jgi:hypothetical protein